MTPAMIWYRHPAMFTLVPQCSSNSGLGCGGGARVDAFPPIDPVGRVRGRQ